MALADLIRTLEAEAAEQREAVLAEARERAHRIRLDAEASSDRTRAESLGRADRDARDEARRAVAAARHEASTRVLTARARLLERVRASVEERFERAGTDPAYLETLPRELNAALGRLGAGPVEARARPELVASIERVAAPHARVRIVPVADGAAGYTLRSADGAVEVDATLPARLELSWPEVAVLVLREVDG